MIPTIEQIVERLLAGEISKQQAIGWLHQHAEDAGYALRDEFAGRAMNGMLANSSFMAATLKIDVAMLAYEQADAMLAARTEPASEAEAK